MTIAKISLHCILNDLPNDIICNIAIYADDNNTLYSKCDQASDLWKQLELASKFQELICSSRHCELVQALSLFQ